MGNLIKGLTVEIGGDTTKLGKALEDVNKKSGSLSSELGQINKLLKLDPGNTDLLTQKQKVLSDAIGNTAKKLETLKAAEAQVQDQFKKGEVSEEQVRALQREIIATEKKMDSYEKAAEETERALKGMGDETKNVTEHSGKLGKALGDAAKVGMKAVTAAAAAAGAAVAGMGAALVNMAAEGAVYADTVLTESTVTGIATDKLQEYMYAAELVDVSTDTLTKSMAKQIKSMKAVQDGTKLSVEAYDKLGVQVMNADGTLRDSDTVYWEVIDALGKMENETERDALAMQILGKSAQELNPLIEAGAERMTELGAQAQEAGYVLSDDMLASYGALSDQMEYLKVGATGAKNALGTVLLPVLTDLAGEGVDLLGEFTEGIAGANGDISAMADVVAEILPKAINKILEYVPEVLSVATAIVGALGSALLDNMPMLVQAAVDLGSSLVSSLISMLPQFVTTGVDVLMAILDGITQVIPQVTQAIVDMIPQLVDALVTGIPQLIDGAVQLFLALTEAIPQIIPPLVEALPQIIVAVVKGLTDNIPALVQGAITLFMAIVQAIPQIVVELGRSLPQIISAIVKGLLNGVSTIRQTATKLGTELVTKVMDTLKALPKKVLSVGKDLVTGLWNGVSDKLSWLKNKISGFAESVLGSIKNFFGVHSPSTKTTWIGEMLDEGLADGVLDHADAPIKAMQRVSGNVLAAATGDINGLAIERQLRMSGGAGTPGQAAAVDTSSLLAKLDGIYERLGRIKMVTDRGTLVGEIVDIVDAALAERQLLDARGV